MIVMLINLKITSGIVLLLSLLCCPDNFPASAGCLRVHGRCQAGAVKPPSLDLIPVPPHPPGIEEAPLAIPTKHYSSGPASDYGIGPFRNNLSPGSLDFFGWNDVVSTQAYPESFPIRTAPAMPGQVLVFLNARIAVASSPSSTWGSRIYPTIQIRNLGSRKISRIWLEFRSSTDQRRFFTEPLRVAIPPLADAKIGPDIEFLFTSFPTDLAPFEIAISRVEFDDGNCWSNGSYPGWRCAAEPAPEPLGSLVRIDTDERVHVMSAEK
jgi:hypothetical protein